MATVKLPRRTLNAFPNPSLSNERAVQAHKKSTQQTSLRRSERLFKQRKAKTQFLHISNPGRALSSTKITIGSRGREQLKYLATAQKPHPQPKFEPADQTQPSFLEAMTKNQISRALSYYYHFPQYLPFRESGAIGKANGTIPEVLVRFDEAVFVRKSRLRPVPDDELESVDPFTI